MTQQQTPTTDSTPPPPDATYTVTITLDTSYNGKPAIRALVTTGTGTGAPTTTVQHTLWVQQPNLVCLTTQTPHHVHIEPLPEYAAGINVEQCLLLAMYASELTRAIEGTLTTALQGDITALLSAHHKHANPLS